MTNPIINRLDKHILVDGFHVVVDENSSDGCWIKDTSGKRYLDCYSQFASQPLGWNHAAYHKVIYPIHKLANSDMYSETYADFVDEFASITPDFKHFFFIDGGALAVENALKAAFDWKAQISRITLNENEMSILHFKQAFHGRSGYTMSLTNTDPMKVSGFPKFPWPRMENPKIVFPQNNFMLDSLEKDLMDNLNILNWKKIAAIIVEPIQGEGGDNQFRPSFFRMLREFADKNDSLLIFDEVQTGLGMTGKMWCYEHYNVVPDIMCFGKKTQVCGFCSTERIEEAPKNVFERSSRINSTWGGNNFDMARSTLIIKAIKDENLVENASRVGKKLLEEVSNLKKISNVRGLGLMVAFDMKDKETRDKVHSKLCENMLALKCGDKSIRLRPHLDFPESEVSKAVEFIEEALA